MSSFFSIVVGLGNPGDEYRETRHNIGFSVVESVFASAKDGGALTLVSGWRTKHNSQIAAVRMGGEQIWLVKPQRFMNLSGPPVREIMDFYQLPCERLLVVHDDIDLPLGKLRIRQGGGDGGHKGIRSLISTLGSPGFSRLRVGISRPVLKPADEPAEPHWEEPSGISDWVLGHFDAEERPVVDQTIARAMQAVEALCASGVQKAQCLFNSSPDEQ
jgi:peptidyl-tRNA hydrolase, PTH1 family